MSLLLLAAALATPVPSTAECIYDTVPATSRSTIGDAILAKRAKDVGDAKVFVDATDTSARRHGWSVDQALHANGYAAMRFAADRIAGKLGHASWSAIALESVRERPRDQIENLARTGAGNAEFELVLARMIGEDPAIPQLLKSQSQDGLQFFVLMVKLLAVAETERFQV